MTEQQSTPDDEPIQVDQTDKRSMTPFIAAAILAAIVLVAVFAGGLLSPAEKNVTESDRIAAAVGNYVGGRAQRDEVPAPGTACAGFDEAESPLAAQFGPGGRKSVEIAKIEGQTVNGDRAKATVTTKADGKETTATWNLVRSDGKWLVCD
ncbi:Rv0361 family membrane protein [Nocardia goodfellowii]|uniref:DUF4878 domain-containing protein n=1 Tax=Nocardia goodfellowii TaxID=882446 RepID=A0ABS4QA48_9NOCA|nr:hypothetical protein [Nocardia goodfellowii]MBP2188565.1 hypothetical protein [Nocardia goodfellowii]